MATPEQIQALRYELADTDTSLPYLSDSEYTYFLTKNNDSHRRAMVDCAKTILLKLSMRGDESVDIFSIKGSKVAEQYRLALQLFLRDPNLNPALTMAQAYAGGVSRSDMQANEEDEDANAVFSPTVVPSYPKTYFEI